MTLLFFKFAHRCLTVDICGLPLLSSFVQLGLEELSALKSNSMLIYSKSKSFALASFNEGKGLTKEKKDKIPGYRG